MPASPYPRGPRLGQRDWTARRSLTRPCAAIPEVEQLGWSNLYSGAGLSPHDHGRCMEICYIRSGRVLWWVNDEVHEITGGQVYITRPHERHGAYDTALDPSEINWLILGLPRTPRQRWLGLPPAEAQALSKALLAISARKFHVPAGVRETLDRLFEALQADHDALQPTAARAWLVCLLSEIARAAADHHPSQPLSPPVAQAVRLMMDNLAQPRSLSQIAQAVGWSLSHLKARFRREMSISPAQFYLRRRIEAVLEAISRGSPNLAALAQQMGFCSSQYLATCVKRLTGRSPGMFRKRNR